jgi:nucleoside-diphosphate-sugar epimerase
MTMRALVTGATGFIGTHLVETLLARGDSVTCLVRPTSNRTTLATLSSDRLSFAEGNVLDRASLEGPTANVDVVFHLAALLKVPWRADFHQANEDGARNVAAACANADAPPTLVVVSSLAAGGVQPGDRPRTEADSPAPVSRYGRAKLSAERAATAFADRVPITVVRPPMVFGPRDRSVLSLFRMAARGWFLTPTRKTTHVSLVAAEDLAALLVLVATKGERVIPVDESSHAVTGHGIYYAAAEEAPTLPELARLLAAATDRPAPRVLRAPAAVTRVAGGVSEALSRVCRRPAAFNRDKAREATAGSWVCSPAKAQALGFRPRPLATSLRATAVWYQAAGLV